MEKNELKCLRCTPLYIMLVESTLVLIKVNKQGPEVLGTLTGPLTTNAKQTSEAAMFHRNTPHTGRAALTLKKITWRFLVLGEHAPVIVHITASSEQEARAAMPPCCIAIFAARIMRGGSANA
ncbi:host cell division inhibitor Icd-like protein [Edwardsiella piscicida]|uniref:host cell division inhibitor Icd-like protein n=2 Tax=Edwardsiella TaxID=635 RepID=UPI002A68F263|nr:host cell division inhibitor Icd-like protein [Edwardsiella piscicida]